MEFDVTGWYKKISINNHFINYSGIVTDDVINDLLDKIEIKLEDTGEKLRVIRRVYNISVEVLQNLFHHSDVPPNFKEADKRFAIFSLSKLSSGNYNVISGNFVRAERVRIIRDRIEQINYLTKQELRVIYKLVLSNDEFSLKGGGGLGMVDIARKTKNKLTFEFVEHSHDYKFFIFDITVS